MRLAGRPTTATVGTTKHSNCSAGYILSFCFLPLIFGLPANYSRAQETNQADGSQPETSQPEISQPEISQSISSEASPIARWDRVVSLVSPSPTDAKVGKQCTAFVVLSHSQLFLVTAKHASAETSRKTRLFLRSPAGKT